MKPLSNSAIMISPDLNFREFLKKLEGMDKPETIRVASRESYEAKDIKTKRGDKAREQKLIEYISDLGSFLYFVRNGDILAYRGRRPFSHHLNGDTLSVLDMVIC